MDQLEEALPDVGSVRLVCVWARGDPSASKAPRRSFFSSRGMGWRAPRERTISSSRLITLGAVDRYPIKIG